MKKEKEKEKEKKKVQQKKYTKKDMISFAEHILLINTGSSGEDIEPEFNEWLKDN